MSIIEVKNLSKKYYIGEKESYTALRDVLANVARNPLKWVGEKVKSSNYESQEFWALKDINFTVNQGEVLGIIGRNGAGKSTLLKILSRITPPTTGQIRIRGRVGSLLEVGTGFHPELTGRENIFLNGAILGMRKKEIEKKFDQIVDFSGVETFLDTPVKRYSSGMYVRLAFSVAAHLEPDILIIDEVLAVGDAEFQKKCFNKMKEVTKREGRTVLFVSHNMSAVQDLCTKAIFLENSTVKKIGEARAIVQDYIYDINAIKDSEVKLRFNSNKIISFSKVWITNSKGEITNNINVDDECKIWLEFNVRDDISAAEISIGLKNSSGVNVVFTSLSDSNNRKFYNFKKGKNVTSVTIKGNFLIPDNYSVMISAHFRGTKEIESFDDIIRLIIIETGSVMVPYGSVTNSLACVLVNAEWRVLD
ncbi:MAG: ABC transporter ATP-binding protein [Candidatus Falkowbacteria bacterium]|nr:ABC transporter ATP-binding protein [Candidatus Falkowbacteria bacterium]